MNAAVENLVMPGGGASITALPKISLHDHLDGGLRPQTIIELADEIGYQLPENDVAKLTSWFADQSDSGSLVDYLKTFDVTIAVMQTVDGLKRVASEFVHDLAADGVIYGEIRWAPEQHLQQGLDLDQVVAAVQQGLEEGVDAVRSSGRSIRVGQLLSSLRHTERGTDIAELALRHRDRGVIGFDIAGPEAGFPPSRLRGAFDLLAHNYLPATVHADEALGHGVRLAEDITIANEDDENTYVTLGDLAQWVKDREIALELSPSSNLQTGAIEQWGDEMIDHPFDLLYQLGFRVTVNTDNRLMSATTLSRELALLTEAFGYDLTDLEVFQINAAAAAFLPIEEREELSEAISVGFERA